MTFKKIAAIGATAAAVLMFQAGCDWSSSGNSINSSQGAGVNLNFSGVYKGNSSGGRAVASTSGGSINRLVISHSGNLVEIVDNNGSRYEGTIGSPGVVSTPDANGDYPAGAELVQSQISFSGTDGSAGRKIEFVGIIHAVSVTDVRGTVTGSGTTNSSTQTDTENDQETTTETRNDGTNTVVTTIITVGSPGDAFYQQNTTTVTYNNATGEEISRVNTSVGTDISSDSTVTGSYTQYEITEANTQYRLEGTWVEEGGKVSGVDALSSGSAGLITTTTTTDTTTAQ